MEIVLIAIGKTNTKYIEEGIQTFFKRLSYYINFSLKIIPDAKNHKLNKEKQKELEGKQILNEIKEYDYLVLLDERGNLLSSTEFANWINKRLISNKKRLIFIIGGPYGFSEEVYKRADYKLSLSKMTFTHEMVRLFFIEQIYRAFTILRGENYHHE